MKNPPVYTPTIKPAQHPTKKPKHLRLNLATTHDLDELQELMEVELIQEEEHHRRIRKVHFQHF